MEARAQHVVDTALQEGAEWIRDLARVRKAREILGMEQGPFAELIGVSRGTVSNYERDSTPMAKAVVLNAWAMATGVPVEWLKNGEAPRTDGPGGAAVKYAIRDSNPEPAD